MDTRMNGRGRINGSSTPFAGENDDAHSTTSSDISRGKIREREHEDLEDARQETTERTPLIARESEQHDLVVVSDLGDKARRRRLIGKGVLCLLLWTLASALIIIVVLAAVKGPALVEVGVRQGLGYNLSSVRVESVEDEGVLVRFGVDAQIDLSKVDRWSARTMLRMAPMLVRELTLEPPDTGLSVLAALPRSDEEKIFQEWGSVYIPSISLPLSGLFSGHREWNIAETIAFRIRDNRILAQLAALMVNGTKEERKQLRLQVQGSVSLLPGPLPRRQVSLTQVIAPKSGLGLGLGLGHQNKSLPKIELRDFALEADHPKGGIAVSASVVTRNPTPFGLDHLPMVNWGIWLDSSLLPPAGNRSENALDTAQRLMLAIVAAEDTVIEPSAPLTLHLKGRILPIAKKSGSKGRRGESGAGSEANEDLLNTLLSRYLTGRSTPVMVQPLFDADRDLPLMSLPPPGKVPSQPALPQWAQDIVAQLSLVVPFPGSPQDDVKRGFVQGLKMRDFHTRTDLSGHLRSSGHATGRLTLPRNIDTSKVILDVVKLRPEVYIYDGPVDESEAFALIAVPKERGPQPANTTRTFDPETGKNITYIETDIIDAPMKILPGKGSVFRHFIKRLFVTHEGVVGLQGKVQDVTIASGLGQLRLGGLPIRGQFPISELNRGRFLELLRAHVVD